MNVPLLLLTLSLCLATAPQGNATNLQVLCYHQIATDARDIMTTTPKLFEEQVKYLSEHGYQGVSVEEGAAFLKGKKTLKGKPIIITFDDGYDGVYTYGLPVLKKYHMPAVVFLVVGMITERGTPQHLTWKQVREMHDSGIFTIGSHSHSLHVRMPAELDSGKLTVEKIEKDLKKSKDAIEKHIDKPVTSLAWPYGAYDARTVRIATKVGFSTLFTTDYGPNHPGDGSLHITRIRLSSSYDSIPRLAEKLGQYR